MGGSIFVHTFGAYFGLAVSWAVTDRSEAGRKRIDAEESGGNKESDLFAMVGTIFLWMFWPSFNGALAPSLMGSQHRVIINTVFALSASALTSFALSAYFHNGKFCMEDIQNATLAGGVAVGSSSDLVIGPGGALGIGVIAGVISVLGYKSLKPILWKKLGIHDTCGVHNLHG